MISRKNLIEKVEKWVQGSLSSWRISNWAGSCIYRNEQYEDEVVKELIEMLSNVGSDMDYCTAFVPEQYLSFCQHKVIEDLNQVIESTSPQGDEYLDVLYPTMDEFKACLSEAGWFENMDTEETKDFCEKINFCGLPNLDNIYFQNQEVFWLSALQPSTIFSDQEEGHLIDENDFTFIEDIEIFTDFTYEEIDDDSATKVTSFLVDGQKCVIKLAYADRDDEEIILDFFSQLTEQLNKTKWELIYKNYYIELGDLMFLVLIEREKLHRGYSAGVFRTVGENPRD